MQLDKMKIIQIHGTFYPFFNKVGNYVLNLSKELTDRGHNVTVITSTLGTKKATIKEISGIKIKRLKPIFKIGDTPIIPKLYSELRRVDTDIIHAHLPTPYTADIACYVAKHKDIPCVLTYHNDVIGRGINGYLAAAYNRLILNRTINNTDSIISTQQRYVELSPYLKKSSLHIEVIPYGVDTKRFKPLSVEKRENYIFFLSTQDKHHSYKGLGYLLEALPQIKRELGKLKLIVGGKGDMIAYYRQQVESLGLENEVEFHGFIPNELLAEYYNRCNVFVLPLTSLSREGSDVVLLEALACGIPIVTTDIAGIASDIHKYNTGIVVQPEIDWALAAAIINILKDKEAASEMGQRGRELAESKYSWGKICTDIEVCYQNIARGG